MPHGFHLAGGTGKPRTTPPVAVVHERDISVALPVVRVVGNDGRNEPQPHPIHIGVETPVLADIGVVHSDGIPVPKIRELLARATNQLPPTFFGDLSNIVDFLEMRRAGPFRVLLRQITPRPITNQRRGRQSRQETARNHHDPRRRRHHRRTHEQQHARQNTGQRTPDQKPSHRSSHRHHPDGPAPTRESVRPVSYVDTSRQTSIPTKAPIMPRLDQFESIFRAASKNPFQLQPPAFRRLTMVTDLEGGAAYDFGEKVKAFLRVLGRDDVVWNLINGSEYDSLAGLLELIRTDGPDLIVTYRHLHTGAERSPHTMGEHVEAVTQGTEIPVFLLPHPDNVDAAAHAMENTNVVMALTDHLAGDDALVNAAVALTEPDGTLFLTHIEDEMTFGRYIHAIRRIQAIDTDVARTALEERLLQDARDYIASVEHHLDAADVPITITPIVAMGQHLSLFRDLIERHNVDVLVMNTKDDDQHAMHGLVHPLAVELRRIPLLLL